MNSLFNQMNNNSNAIKKFFDFAKGIKGDPQQMVMQLLNSGQMSQEQFNKLQSMATEFQKILPR